jgi:hypothetical protein
MKRLAKEVFMLRYIPDHRVYEMSITWQSEKPSAPTIVYLSEIFIHPFIAPAHPAATATPSPTIGKEIVKSEPVVERKYPLT